MPILVLLGPINAGKGLLAPGCDIVIAIVAALSVPLVTIQIAAIFWRPQFLSQSRRASLIVGVILCIIGTDVVLWCPCLLSLRRRDHPLCTVTVSATLIIVGVIVRVRHQIN